MESAKINPINPQGDYLFRLTYDLMDQIRCLKCLRCHWWKTCGSVREACVCKLLDFSNIGEARDSSGYLYIFIFYLNPSFLFSRANINRILR